MNANYGKTLIRNSSHINVGKNERIVSVLGGVLLMARGLRHLSRTPVAAVAQIAAGSFLAFRGASGHCPVNESVGRNTAPPVYETLITIIEDVTVNCPRNEVYAFWRQLDNLPGFMKHIHSIEMLSESRSHWQVQLPGIPGLLEWDAVIATDVPDQRISWTSVEGNSNIRHTGTVVFRDTPDGAGTEVHVLLSYEPPAGDIGKAVSRLFNTLFGRMVKEDIKGLKQALEKEEIPVTSAPAKHLIAALH